MKRTYLVLIITMLVIGFAAVATNLAINGTINFGFNNNDFDSNVVFTYTNTMNGTATIQENGKAITFNTTKLENVGQQAIMDFDIANKSKQYDANVTIECGLEEKDKTYEDYLDIKYDLENSAFEIESGDTKSIRLTITLKKAYNESLEKDINMLCEIVATAGERNTEGTYIPKEHQYEEILLNGADPVLEASSVEGISLAAETSNKKLIPVIINDDGTVKRADTTKKWYDYENKEWANAVILADGIEDPGINKEIPEDQIESYFVWIPKYRYKIFDMGNYNDNLGPLNTNKQNQAIEIEFGLESTIDDSSKQECKTPNKSGETGQCANGKWMTHPAFTAFEGVKGFWVGKFETGYNDAKNTTDAQQDTNDSSKIIIKPNVYSWRGISVGNAYKTSYDYQRDLDSRMMKSTEWGMVVYLIHSQYGACDNKVCNEVRINNSLSFVTGVSAKEIPLQGIFDYKDYMLTTPNEENTKSNIFPNSQEASTTSNNTGIFDISGGAWEYVAGVMTSASSVQDINKDNVMYKDSGLTTKDIQELKYIDLYINGNDTQYNRRILGDATAEMGPFAIKKYGTSQRSVCSFFSDASAFIYSDLPWFAYGGSYMFGTSAGIFNAGHNTGAAKNDGTFRIVLAPQ